MDNSAKRSKVLLSDLLSLMTNHNPNAFKMGMIKTTDRSFSLGGGGTGQIHPGALSDFRFTHEDKGDLFKCLQPLLCFIRLPGLTPLTGLFSGKLENVRFRLISLASIQSVFVILFLFAYFAIAVVSFVRNRAKDTSGIVKNLAETVYSLMGFFTYIFMYKTSSKLIRLFHSWQRTTLVFQKEDVQLFRNITLITCVVFISGALENTASHWKFIKAAFLENTNKKGDSTMSEIFIRELFPLHVGLIPSNAISAIALFIGDKLILIAWNFADAFVTVMALALSNKFRHMYEDFKEKIETKKISANERSNWLQLCKDLEVLRELLEEFNELLSPLIIACEFTSLYFISLYLSFFLIPNDHDMVNNIYDACAFAQFILRALMLIMCGAKIPQYANDIKRLLSKCPSSSITKDVERTELMLSTTTLGLKGGNDCFTLTNSFLLTIFNVVFTIEIVLLNVSSLNGTSNSF